MVPPVIPVALLVATDVTPTVDAVVEISIHPVAVALRIQNLKPPDVVAI
jgi:hypothetical protein